MSDTASQLSLSPANRDAAVQRQVHVRWDVKTGTDAAAKQIKTAPTPTTIAQLRSAKAPANWPPTSRVKGVETTLWELPKTKATLVGYKHEQDGDYHLVLSDPHGATMIAEIPDPTAVAAGSTFVGQITAARQAFDDRFGVQIRALDTINERAAATQPDSSAPMIVQVSVPVTVTGIGFFDFIHGQAGVAPNGVELHPVVSILF